MKLHTKIRELGTRYLELQHSIVVFWIKSSMLATKAQIIMHKRSGFVDKKYLIPEANIILMKEQSWVATNVSLEGMEKKLIKGSSSHTYYEVNTNQNHGAGNKFFGDSRQHYGCLGIKSSIHARRLTESNTTFQASKTTNIELEELISFS